MRIQAGLLVALLVHFIGGYSQSKKAENLDITVGASLPIGKYAQKDATKNSSGFAKVGESLNISYVHLITNKFGWTITLHSQRNPLDSKALASDMSRLNYYEGVFASSSINPPPSLGQPNTYGNWKFDKGSWLSGAVLLGAYGQYNAAGSKKFCLTGKISVGAVYASMPELSGKSTSDTAVAQLKRTGATALGFAYMINGGVKLKLNGKVYFITQAEYFGTSSISFKDVQATFMSAHYSNGFPTSASSQTVTGIVKQAIASVNLNVGIGISIK